MGNKTPRQELTLEGFCTIKFLLDKGWNQKQISLMTDYSNQVVSKVARVESLSEYKEKYKQPGGQIYRERRKIENDLSYSCEALGYDTKKVARMAYPWLYK